MRRPLLVIVLLLALIGLAVGGLLYQRGRAPDFKRAGISMPERLQLAHEIARQSTDSASRYFGLKQIDMVREQLADAGPNEQLELRLSLAMELLQAGLTEQAIDEYLAIRESIKGFNAASTIGRQAVSLGLALAYLRLGEQQNCLANHTSESCLFPIEGGGVHQIRDPSRKSINEMQTYLRSNPQCLGCKWLLNLAYMTLDQYPDFVPQPYLLAPDRMIRREAQFQRFPDIASTLGVDVMSQAGGSIIDDFDNDGRLDIICTGFGLHEQMRYFRNSGDGSFEDRTASAGLIGQTGGLNILHADYDNDGWLDVLILRGGWLFEIGDHPNSLLRNNGDGTFTDVTESAGLLTFHPTQTAAWGDYDNDGDLDLFIGNESSSVLTHPCELFRNNGDGTFTDVAGQLGIDRIALVKGVTWGDYNRDGRIDLFLSINQGANVLLRNDGPGAGGASWIFTDVSEAAGIAEPLPSFPTWFFDYNNDGWPDLLVGPFDDFFKEVLIGVVLDYLDMPTESAKCVLYRNDRDGTFTDVAPAMNIDKVLLAMGANFGDLDNDGYLDCYFGTGQPSMFTLIPNRMFRNVEGRGYEDVTVPGGFGNLQKGHGIAFGDLDNDGDQDIYVVMGGAFFGDVYQNLLLENPGNDNKWITLVLEGVQTNRCAIGARIRIEVDTPDGFRSIYRTVGSGGSFGASSLQQEVGLGDALEIRSVTIDWPVSESAQVLKDVPMNRVVRIREGQQSFELLARPSVKLDGGTPGASPHQHHQPED